jgi:hypothetical protein
MWQRHEGGHQETVLLRKVTAKKRIAQAFTRLNRFDAVCPGPFQ